MILRDNCRVYFFVIIWTMIIIIEILFKIRVYISNGIGNAKKHKWKAQKGKLKTKRKNDKKSMRFNGFVLVALTHTSFFFIHTLNVCICVLVRKLSRLKQLNMRFIYEYKPQNKALRKR